jgi:hypothetical protein
MNGGRGGAGAGFPRRDGSCVAGGGAQTGTAPEQASSERDVDTGKNEE